MKFCFLTLLTIFFVTSFAQQRKPAGFANTYTLNATDGFPGNNYVTHAQISPTGKVYIKDFFGLLHVTGNNYYKTISSVKNISNGTNLYLSIDNELFLCDEQGNVTVFKNDSIYKRVLSNNEHSFIINNDGHNMPTLIKAQGDFLYMYRLQNESWRLTHKIMWDSSNKTNFQFFADFKSNKLFLRSKLSELKEEIFLIDTFHLQLKYITTIPKSNNNLPLIIYDDNWNVNIRMLHSLNNFFHIRNYKYINPNRSTNLRDAIIVKADENIFLFNYLDDLHEFVEYDSSHILPESFIIETYNRINHFQKNPNHPSYLVLTNNKPIRVFPYLKKYPHLFKQNNSLNINTILEDDEGRIWAGSYDNNLTIISPGSFKNGIQSSIYRLPKQPYAFMNAALNYHNKLYFVGETSTGGILRYDNSGRIHKLKPNTPNGFYLYHAPKSKTIWMPSAEPPNYPIYYCNDDQLEKPFIDWHKLDERSGIAPFGFSTLTEDKLGRIWIGHPKKGFAVYDQARKKAISYDVHKNQSPIGFVSCITDNKGTIFLGSDNKGLWYYNDYSRPPTPLNIHRIEHPLLNNCPRITSMQIFNKWLVLGCYDRICLLNLDSFYIRHKAVVTCLSPQETAFTSYTEQNTMLVSKKDSTIWFGTNDMLYQWNINYWLSIPKYKVSVHAFIQMDSNRTELSTINPHFLKAGENTFILAFEYLSPDCLPRYTRAALVRQGDSIVFSEPTFQSKFTFSNLTADTYKFYIEVFEQDGSTSQYIYEISINKFLWQHWWFWTLASLLFVTPFILWLNSLRKEAIQQKQISQLNIVTLSSQFRPHFILNALNTIGADLMNKPAAETVISRLGESINLIFNQSQQKQITHIIKNEWVLVENVIDIHRIMYIPELQVEQPDLEWLSNFWNTLVPVGLIEIMVENALLHGLRNKKRGPYILKIMASDDDSNIYFKIIDNGIGRINAMQISSYKRHGSGTNNLNNIIGILNRYNRNKIQIKYVDNFFEDDENSGTAVIIIIPKNYIYEY